MEALGTLVTLAVIVLFLAIAPGPFVVAYMVHRRVLVRAKAAGDRSLYSWEPIALRTTLWTLLGLPWLYGLGFLAILWHGVESPGEAIGRYLSLVIYSGGALLLTLPVWLGLIYLAIRDNRRRLLEGGFR